MIFTIIIVVFFSSVIFYIFTKTMIKRFRNNESMRFIPLAIVFSLLCNIIVYLLYDMNMNHIYPGLIIPIIFSSFIILFGAIIGIILALLINNTY